MRFNAGIGLFCAAAQEQRISLHEESKLAVVSTCELQLWIVGDPDENVYPCMWGTESGKGRAKVSLGRSDNRWMYDAD